MGPSGKSGRPSAASATPAWRNRRYWRWAVLVLGAMALLVVVFRQPLLDLVWPDTRVHGLLGEAETALAQGHLSNTDGTGARERFEAALALDSDRGEARNGLLRVARAALGQADIAIEAGDFAKAQALLQLARELQVPRSDVDAVAMRLQSREAGHAQLDQRLQQAQMALDAGHLEGAPDAALPLFQEVLEVQPNHVQALEGREDALSDLLDEAGPLIDHGQLSKASDLIARGSAYDAGHVDLPELRARLAQAIEQRSRRIGNDLRRGRLDAALRAYEDVAQAAPTDEAVRQLGERIGIAHAQRAIREAADFRFSEADASLHTARLLAPQSAEVAEAAQRLAAARQSQSRMGTALPSHERQRRMRVLLDEMAQAESRGDWLTPPGASAYDKLRAAQALAADDEQVRQAAERLLPAIRKCFETELRANRVRRAQACHEAWRTLLPGDPDLADARRRLAGKWVAIGEERLRAGDVEFAVQALRQSLELDVDAAGLREFGERVRTAQTGRP